MVSERIKELVTTIAERVISVEVRRRSWRVQVLQNRIDAMLALSESRAAMYADEMDGGYEFQAHTLAEEQKAVAEGCRVAPRVEPPPELPADWKSRLLTNAMVSERIKELVTTIAERVISVEVRRRSWRVQVLQNRIDAMLALSESRAAMYADEMDGGYEFQAHTLAEEQKAVAEGCRVASRIEPPPELPADWKDKPTPAPPPEYPKTMLHPGHPNGGATGLLVKDYRGKDANQVVWKFDSALEARIADDLKQAAIEEGQWTERRDLNAAAGLAEMKARINRGRDRLAAEKKAALARGEVWR